MPDKIVEPLDLRRTAAAVARSQGTLGAAIVTVDEQGRVRVGTHNLTTRELRDLACELIRASYIVEEGGCKDVISGD